MQNDELADKSAIFISPAKGRVYEILTAAGISILAAAASAIGLTGGSGLLLPALCTAFAAMALATGYLAAGLARDLTSESHDPDPAPSLAPSTSSSNNLKQNHV